MSDIVKVTIEVETRNAAFDDNLPDEVARIIGNLMNRFYLYSGALDHMAALDINGNEVGKLTVERETD
ncbi:MAG: hypothetical protein R3324_15295 [Halobacteriales archaeon]|nr:hypothetical protein [Halobacteriales archaeon]